MTLASEKMISAENVHFSYDGKTEILKGITADIEKGQFVAVLGHNGSGKSTFARLINSILVPTEGKITVLGTDTSDEEKLYDIRRKVGMVFQNPDNQIVAAVVEEDVAFGLENTGVPPEEIRERVDEALKAVGMYEYRKHSPGMLSGGQKQRVAIAGIIAMRPECIVLDEPTSMLDPAGRKDVMNTIKKLCGSYGITVLLITHYMDEAVQADRVIVIDEGRVILDGVPKNVFSNVEILKKAGLDVPQVTELVFKLRKQGIDIDPDVLTEEECVNALASVLKEGKT
ncbi:MAG: energy-coupling factor transporter ATPase [Oscillospiraceae bacterium]|nr:energy-coupling factor transporter ATPase [Oscillospiraceae bacterium]MBP1590779.1 energy-coupling factor transporter ATPase [Oscillospiraceae bacterium]MBR3026125.1 energy-coupling factor transporter ATPase [Oscillospiraceae bacterium]MBR3537135.1 energy-coupling factor transporter ATPase [Oscillospiraceae bacterium]